MGQWPALGSRFCLSPAERPRVNRCAASMLVCETWRDPSPKGPAKAKFVTPRQTLGTVLSTWETDDHENDTCGIWEKLSHGAPAGDMLVTWTVFIPPQPLPGRESMGASVASG